MVQSMNDICIPFDVSFHFDERLREVPNAPDEMQRAVNFLLAQLEDTTTNPNQKVYLYGVIGVYARILGDFTLAHSALANAIALSEQLNDERLNTLNQLRLAHLYQWQQQYALSDHIFRKLLVRCVTNPALERYLDFVYQHFGKSKFDQGKYATAQKFFEEALTLRWRKGERSLIKSTQFALKITQQQLAASSIA